MTTSRAGKGIGQARVIVSYQTSLCEIADVLYGPIVTFQCSAAATPNLPTPKVRIDILLYESVASLGASRSKLCLMHAAQTTEARFSHSGHFLHGLLTERSETKSLRDKSKGSPGCVLMLVTVLEDGERYFQGRPYSWSKLSSAHLDDVLCKIRSICNKTPNERSYS